MIYYYNLKKNRVLWENTDGFFWCPDDPRLEDPKVFTQEHSEPQKIGDVQYKIVNQEKKETPEGTLITTQELRWKASRKLPPICRCGKVMEWMGYPVWLEKRVPAKKKEKELWGGSDNPMYKKGYSYSLSYGCWTKTIWKRYFKKRSKQKEFIQKLLDKD